MGRTACRPDGDRPVPHARKGGDANVFFAVEHKRIVLAHGSEDEFASDSVAQPGATYDFIGHDEEVMLLSNRSDLLQLFPGEHLADGVVRRVHNDHLRARRDGAAGAV